MRSVIRAACPPAKRAASEEGAFSLKCGASLHRSHPSVACRRLDVTQQLRPPMGSSSLWAPPRLAFLQKTLLFCILIFITPSCLHTSASACLHSIPSFPSLLPPSSTSWPALLASCSIECWIRQIGGCSKGGRCFSSCPLVEGQGGETQQSVCKFPRAGLLLAAT